MEIDESNLSGETRPRKKTVGALPTGLSWVPVVERKNIAFMGTLVRGGSGKGIVVGTGVATEFGAIWSIVKNVDDKRTPLQLKMEELGKHLSYISVRH